MKTLKVATLAALLGVASTAFAATPDLSVRVVGETSAAAGANQKVASIVLTAGSADVTIQSLPVTTSGNVSNCTLRDNSGAAISFAQPLRLQAGAVQTIAYTCTVGSGGSATISVVPGSIVATTQSGTASIGGVPTTNPSATVSLGGSSTTPGVPNTGSGNGNTTTTPGVPNTGVGGAAAATWMLLVLSGIAAVAGALYMARIRKTQ